MGRGHVLGGSSYLGPLVIAKPSAHFAVTSPELTFTTSESSSAPTPGAHAPEGFQVFGLIGGSKPAGIVSWVPAVCSALSKTPVGAVAKADHTMSFARGIKEGMWEAGHDCTQVVWRTEF